MEVYIRAYNHIVANEFSELNIGDNTYMIGALDLDVHDSHYPKRSDIKIMRRDVIASILVVGNLLDKLDLSDDTLRNMGVYVANGAFLEEGNKYLGRAMKTLSKIQDIKSKEEKRTLIYKNISPLTALETLTNSATSFIAQYHGVKGCNTTFGNTSYSSYIAIEQGMLSLKNKSSDYVLVGGANASGVYSVLAHRNFYKEQLAWKESASSAFLLLQNNPKDCIVRISEIGSDQRVPSLTNDDMMKNNWGQFFKSDSEVQMIIFSGGYTPVEFNSNLKIVKGISDNYFSFYNSFGNLGTTAMTMNLIKGIEYIEQGIYSKVDLLDKDPYGRETHIQIQMI